jgi:SAM-dependent methyltransferase
MATAQTWDPESYAKNARFVSDLGSPVVQLLAPKPGERILDLGCGDGVLTKKIAEIGCDVVAVDSSAAFIEAARKLGLVAHVVDAAGVHRSLRPGGRFVAECGGFGCVDKIRRALVEALDKRGIDGESRVPWYFPTPGDYATRLERAGFRVDSIALIPRPTPLPGDITGFLETFGLCFLAGLSGRDRGEYLQEVRSVLKPQLMNDGGVWIADYVRLRFAATKTPGR